MGKKARIIKVEASAGAGKTYNLAERYTTLLLSDDFQNSDLNNILAITFTNKAANEMKERILRWLKEAALDRKINGKGRREELSRKAGLSPEVIGKKAMEEVERIILNYTDFNVRTIDSFIRKIILASSIEMGLPPRFDIMTDSKAYVEYIVDEMLDEFEETDRGNNKLLKFIETYIRILGRTSWSAKKILSEELGKLLEKENGKGKIFGESREDFLKIKREEYKENLKKSKELIRELLRGIETFEININQNAKKALSRFLNEGINYLRDLKPKSNGKTWFQEESLDNFANKKSKGKVPVELENLWGDFRNTLSKAAISYSVLNFAPYINLFSDFKGRLEDYKRKKRFVFIDELNSQVHSKLEELDVPQIYINLGTRLFHFLIDEFQDTNRLQWENIWMLIENAFSEGRGTLFLVGDRKQAIYRFRGGDPELFGRVEKYLEAVTGEEILQKKTDKNYRSREEILNFVAKAFSKESLNELMRIYKVGYLNEEIIESYSNVKQSPGDSEKKRGGYVYLKKLNIPKEQGDEKIKENFVELIESLRTRYRDGEIAVLVRKKEQAASVTNWLTGEGIKVISEKTLSIRENRIVREMVSFLRFLDTPLNDLAFAEFITGEIFSKKTKISQREILGFLEEVSDKRGKPLYIKFRSEFSEIWESLFSELFRSVGFLPPYDLAVKIMEIWDVQENFQDSQAFIIHFLEILKEREAQGENNLKNFLEFWDEAPDEVFTINMPEERDAVNVLTIHKAKGLEFPVVIVPFAGISISFPKLLERDKDGTIEFLSPKKELRGVSTELEKLFEEEMARQFWDELNTLYVAFTRVEDELYVIVPATIDKRNNPKDPLFSFSFGMKEKWVGDELKLGETIQREKGEIVKEPEFEIRTGTAWAERLVGRELKKVLPDKRERKAMERGELIHAVLEKIKNGVSSKEELRKLIDQEIRARLIEENSQEILAKLNKVISSNDEVFNLSPTDRVFTEKEIINQKGERFKIDRLIVKSDEVLVVDYKTGEEYKEEHEEQIKNYMALVSRIYPHKRTKGILIYVDKEEKREVQWGR